MLLAFTLLFAQSSSSSGSDGGGAFLGLLCACCPFIFVLLLAVPTILGMWKVFVKAGEPGWASLLPIYNAMVLAKIGGKEPTFGLFTLIPVYGVYVAFVILADVCKAFGKDTLYVVGLLFLPFVFWPMLGYGSARYSLAAVSGGSSRRSRDDDYEDRPRRARDEDEDDEDRPRRRR